MTAARAAAISCAAGLVPAMILWPAAAALTGADSGWRRRMMALLLCQVVYLLGAFACLAILRLDARGTVRAVLMASAPAVLVTALALWGLDLVPAAACQAAAAASACFAWGAGRAARTVCAKEAAASTLAFLVVCAVAAGLLPASHISGATASWPLAGELALAANPFVAVASGAGFDLIRSGPLYGRLSISGRRFEPPRPWLPPLVLGGLGAALAFVRIPRRRRATHDAASNATSSRRVHA